MCVCAEKGQLSRFRKVQGTRRGYARDHGGPARTLHFQPHHTRILLCLCLWTRRRGCASSGRTRRARSLGGSRRWSRLCHLCCSTLWGTGHGHLGTGHGAQAEGGGQWLEQVSYTHENTRTRVHARTGLAWSVRAHTHRPPSHDCELTCGVGDFLATCWAGVEVGSSAAAAPPPPPPRPPPATVVWSRSRSAAIFA